MKRKSTGLIGLFSGRKIKAMAAKGERLTPSQTAKQALRAIERKYKGQIVDSAKYYHTGRGNWVRRSKEADARRTGKVTTDIKKWRRRPHKYDLKGVDTKGSCPKKKKTKPVTKKVKLSPSMLKAPAPKRRRGPGPKTKPVLKTISTKPKAIIQKPVKRKPDYKPTKQHREWVNEFKSVVTGKLQGMGAKKIKFVVSGPYNVTDYRAYVTYEAGPNTDIARIKVDDAAHGLSNLTAPYFSIVQWKEPKRTLPQYIKIYAKNKYLKFFVEDYGKPFKMEEVNKSAAGYLDRTDFTLAKQREMKNSPMSKKTFTNSLMKKMK